MKKLTLTSIFILSIIVPGIAYAASENTQLLDLTSSRVGIVSIVVFTIAYATVIIEEFLHLRKSKPVIIAAGIIWFLEGIAKALYGQPVRCRKYYVRINKCIFIYNIQGVR